MERERTAIVSEAPAAKPEPGSVPGPVESRRLPRYLAACAAAVVVWIVVYANLQPFAAWLTYALIGLGRGSRLASAVAGCDVDLRARRDDRRRRHDRPRV